MITAKIIKLTKENIFNAVSEMYIFNNIEELEEALEPFELGSKSLWEVNEFLKKVEDNNGPFLIKIGTEQPEITKSRIRKAILTHRNNDVYREINIEEIYGRVKKLAKKNEVKLKDVLEDCGFCYTYFSTKICKSQNTVSKKLIANLADYFDVSEEYLLRGDKFIVEHINHPIVDTTTGQIIGFNNSD